MVEAALVSIRNMDRLNGKLRKMSPTLLKVANRQLKVTAVKVERSAKLRATGQLGGPHVRTGVLRNSITHEVDEGKSLFGRGFAGPVARVGTNTHYAPFVEFGTSKAKEHPFLLPAFFDEMQGHVQRLAQAINKVNRLI